jgi:hypothetical protein
LDVDVDGGVFNGFISSILSALIDFYDCEIDINSVYFSDFYFARDGNFWRL